ncbi:MAG: thioredoxin domain-containing protein [Polyangiaceae bacterium]|jgi:protein-disulfide isomerase
MRHAIVLLASLAVTPLGCSHVTSDPSPGPSPAPTGANAELPAGVAAAKVYRVPVDGLPAVGQPDALVTIVAFTDYQCPYCRHAEETLTQLRASYGSQVRLVVAEKPLPMHDRARPAALAALAASSQGAFDPMRAKLFAGPLDDDAIAKAASDLGLDAARFDADRTGAAAQSLAGSEALADRLGVRGTPTFFINGRHLVGAQPIETFRAVIDERLAAARALVATGVRPADVYARAIAGGAERVEEPAEDKGPGCGGDGECKGDGNGDTPDVGDAIENVPTDLAPSRGPARASVTIVEFADFQCPFCVRAEGVVHAVEQAHPGDVRVVFKNLPLPFHDHARLMAKAAVAADAQGHYWDMHDRLFALTGTVDRGTLDGVARTLGLDVARFDRDLDDPALDARIDADGADAKALGVKGTPTFFVNGRRIIGAQPAAVFEKAIARK